MNASRNEHLDTHYLYHPVIEFVSLISDSHLLFEESDLFVPFRIPGQQALTLPKWTSNNASVLSLSRKSLVFQVSA